MQNLSSALLWNISNIYSMYILCSCMASIFGKCWKVLFWNLLKWQKQSISCIMISLCKLYARLLWCLFYSSLSWTLITLPVVPCATITYFKDGIQCIILNKEQKLKWEHGSVVLVMKVFSVWMYLIFRSLYGVKDMRLCALNLKMQFLSVILRNILGLFPYKCFLSSNWYRSLVFITWFNWPPIWKIFNVSLKT